VEFLNTLKIIREFVVKKTSPPTPLLKAEGSYILKPRRGKTFVEFLNTLKTIREFVVKTFPRRGNSLCFFLPLWQTLRG